jgi:hypothetical protein
MLPLNDQNLPYPDTLHPIIVHFVIAMVLFAYVCDLVGYFTRNYRLLEVSWWNLVVASVAIFFAVIFGEFEAALAQAYPAAQPVLDWHTISGLNRLARRDSGSQSLKSSCCLFGSRHPINFSDCPTNLFRLSGGLGFWFTHCPGCPSD